MHNYTTKYLYKIVGYVAEVKLVLKTAYTRLFIHVQQEQFPII